MRIAISTDGEFVSPHFGRCPTFTLVDIENGEIVHTEEISNPGHHPGFLPEFLSQKGIQYIICGGMGRRAQSLFAEKGIEPFSTSGRVDEVIEKFARGELEQGTPQCRPGSGRGYGIEKGVCEHPREGKPHKNSTDRI